jgi:hypothetical protein
MITIGFLALMILALLFYFKEFPEVLEKGSGEGVQWE